MRRIFFIWLFLVFLPATSYAEIEVQDDSGQTFRFVQPVTRIVSLAPHATELLFDAGASKQVIGTVSFSDYPQAAREVPRIGDFNKIDYEKLLGLKPQLVVYWQHGNPKQMIDAIRKLGLPLFNIEPRKFSDVARSLSKLGKLLGTEKQANQKAASFRQRLLQLKQQYSHHSAKKVRVFYQVWNQPLMTINKQHLINNVIEFCGGINVFANMTNKAPRVDIEAVMKKNPDTIITGLALGREQWLKEWSRWKDLQAVKNNRVFGIDAELIVRQTPRILDGTERMCELLESVREDS